MDQLKSLQCVPCRGGEPTVTDTEMTVYLSQIPDWEVVEVDGIKRLVRQFKLKNFRQALDFTIQVGELAEEQDHHPLIQTEWGKVRVSWWTHKIKGLHRNDFIMAARTGELYQVYTEALS